MKYILTSLLLLSVIVLNAQNVGVGIGTTTPSGNAILDVNSANKGLMLPRVNDTTNIANPSAGLFIYNKRSNSPNYYNGSQWRGVTDVAEASAGADSITYTLAGGTESGTVKGLLQANSFPTATPGGTGGGRTVVGTLAFSKTFDANTIVFRRAGITQVHYTTIEFKFYRPGATTPYYSIKPYDVSFINSNDYQANPTDGLFENYTINFSKIGYKDWINDVSFSWNLATFVIGTY